MIHDVYAGFKIPYECVHLALHFSATREANERGQKKEGELSILSSQFSIQPGFPLLLRLLVFGSEAELLTRRLAE